MDDSFGGDVARIAVEENLALFLVVRWDDRRITYANLQALWAEVPLRTLITGEVEEKNKYLRLDYDLSALGQLLKESQPHVHMEADGEPRFLVPASIGDDVVGWFIDFVYRNFLYEDWIMWAENAWDNWCRERNRDNRWDRLRDAFASSKHGVIESDQQLKQDLRNLKSCLLEERRGFFPLLTDSDRGTLFAHDL